MIRQRRLWVIKIGGSVDEEPGALTRLLSVLTELACRERMVIVPGGGVYADFVRARYAARHTSDATAHFQAVLAMAQFGYQIAGAAPNFTPVHDKAEIETALRRGLVPVFIPYPWIIDVSDISQDWSVTSDTIAIRVSEYLQATGLALLKSVDGASDESGAVIGDIDASAPPVTDVVDAAFFKSLKSGREAWIINGRAPERLKELVETGSTAGTRALTPNRKFP